MNVGRWTPAACLLAALTAAGCAPATQAPPAAQPPRTVQPGAPGEPTREVGAGELGGRDVAPPTEAEIAFFRGMLAHHAQALVMTALVPERTDSRALALLAERIEVSQRDEIGQMQAWLRAHGLEAPSLEQLLGSAAAHHHHMPGMLTDEQLAALRAAQGERFERLFLELMIQHHQGALVMVDRLMEAPGATQDPLTYQFASEVVADQGAEIERMQALLAAM